MCCLLCPALFYLIEVMGWAGIAGSHSECTGCPWPGWSGAPCLPQHPAEWTVSDRLGTRSQTVHSLSSVAAQAAPRQVAAWPVRQRLQCERWRWRWRRRWSRCGNRRKAPCVQSRLRCLRCRHSGWCHFKLLKSLKVRSPKNENWH